jgi:sulfatase maturation enzyme AslB (radical SAM superfamily)
MTQICIDAFKNLNIVKHNNQLSLSPCCLSLPRTADKIEFYDNQYLKQIREEWRQGHFPTECANCQTAEKLTGFSRRTHSNLWYQDHGYYNNTVEMIRLDYWTGDQCNLACAICGPYSSSTWKQELKLEISLQKSVINQFWKTLDLTQLKFVHFNGGEPLLSKEHVIFLQAIPNKKQVQLNYNTNATILPTAQLVELWNQFNLVKLDFSIDDIGPRFNYQRYPADWNQVTDNLQWFLNQGPHNCMLAVNTTVSVLNYYTIAELDQWLNQNFYVSQFTDPIEHRRQPVFGILSMDNINNPYKIQEYLDSLDSRRGTDWKSTFPELKSILLKP